MIKISKKAQYGLRAMVFLAKNYKSKSFFSAKTISVKEGIPFEFLEKNNYKNGESQSCKR
jgi:DNA-binding IscR family transcriptional regulator